MKKYSGKSQIPRILTLATALIITAFGYDLGRQAHWAGSVTLHWGSVDNATETITYSRPDGTICPLTAKRTVQPG